MSSSDQVFAGLPGHKQVLDRALEPVVMRKVTLRLIPFLFLLYMLNILDRVNIGFARLGMMKVLHMEEGVYALGAGIFFIGYFIFEVPSNLAMRQTGARRWIGRIMISWGLVSASMMFVSKPWGFYFLRFLLGVAEAGFFPGIILYMSFWFPARQRAHAMSKFLTASAVTGILGNPISGLIMQHMDQTAGLAGWQWLFLLEGLPTIIIGIVTLWYLTDTPADAHWLSETERTWLAERMRQEHEVRAEHHGFTIVQAFGNPRVWLLCALYFTVAAGSNSFGAYAPQILADTFRDASKVQIGLLAAIPSIAAVLLMLAVGWNSDRTGERRWHVAGVAFCGGIGWSIVANCEHPYLRVLGLTMAQAGMLSMLAPFWSLPTSFLRGIAAAGGIAFINSVGNLGGFFAPNIIGRLKDITGNFSEGCQFLGAMLLVGVILAMMVRHDRDAEAS